jgi:malate/lactate dehydrogenase
MCCSTAFADWSTDNGQTVTGYLPEDGKGLEKAFTGADIVVIPAGIPRKSGSE